MLDDGRMTPENSWLAGVDGCRDGWLVVFVRPSGNDTRIQVFTRFADIANALERPAIIAVDMPIGLPDRSPLKGRAAEQEARARLGDRRSSVFRIPSRAAVEASVAAEPADPRERFFHACAIARETSDDGKGFSKQSFYILHKVAELDTHLRTNSADVARVHEVHPELAFWRLNGEHPLGLPKKIKGRCHPLGLELRRDILIRAGMPHGLAHAATPRGAAEDDLLDAIACAAIARRIHAGLATPFPASPPRDRYGLPMAIWA